MAKAMQRRPTGPFTELMQQVNIESSTGASIAEDDEDEHGCSGTCEQLRRLRTIKAIRSAIARLRLPPNI